MAGEGERQVTQVVEEPWGEEEDWTLEEYVRTVGQRLEKHEPGDRQAVEGAGTIPVRLERMREVMERRGDEHPRLVVSAGWWRRVLAELRRELDEGEEGEAG